MTGTQKKSGRAVLIYDGECPVCRKAVAWITENMRRGAFETIPCRSGEARKKFPFIEQAVCMKAMQLILPDGEVLSGEKALPEIVKRLKRYSPAAALFDLPGAEILARSFYRWFADNRYHIANLLFPDKKNRDRDNT